MRTNLPFPAFADSLVRTCERTLRLYDPDVDPESLDLLGELTPGDVRLARQEGLHVVLDLDLSGHYGGVPGGQLQDLHDRLRGAGVTVHWHGPLRLTLTLSRPIPGGPA